MFNTRFNNNFEPMDNTNNQYNGVEQNPWDNNMHSYQGPEMQYIQPYQGSQMQYRQPYARGGRVKPSQADMMSSLAEMIRRQGEGEDRILAHINPEEAEMLATSSGGDINPVTGLPQFGFFKKPWKAIKSVLGGGAGAVIGNMILPGVGGVIGGALGQGLQHTSRGKSAMQGAFKGAGMGAMLPTASSFLGSGLGSLGAPGVGGKLSQYGTSNAIFPAIDKLFGAGQGGALASSGLGAQIAGVSAGSNIPSLAERTAIAEAIANGQNPEPSFLDSLTSKSKDFFSNPLNLMATASMASQFMNRPKKETPESLARNQKRYKAALQLTPQELAEQEAALLAEAQMQRRIARNKFLPEERLGPIEPVYRKVNTPEEYKRQNRWLSYYNNPQMTGAPIPFKKGGTVKPRISVEILEMKYPRGLGSYIQGDTGGQDDEIPALLSDGEYIIDAATVSHLGDGNNSAGAKRIDSWIENIRKHKTGNTKLPPKAKSLASYMR